MDYSKVYECRIQLFREVKGKVVYYMIVINRQTGAVNSLHKRYSEMRDLYDKLERKIKEYRLDIFLPIFPGRSLLQKTNSDSKRIESRKLELQQFFNDLLKIVKLHSLDLLKEYLPTYRKILCTEKVKETGENQNNSDNSTDSGFAIQNRMILREVDREDGFFKSRLSQSLLREEMESDLLYQEDDQTEKKHRIRVSIERYNYMDDTMYFYVSFFDNISKEQWEHKTRYSALKLFHETLLDKHLKDQLKKFPSRKIFGITNEDPDSIETRRKQLEEYLDHALSQQDVLENEYVKYFLLDTKSQYLAQKKEEEMKKNKIKKRHEQMVKKQANEIVDKAKASGKLINSEQLKKELLSKIGYGQDRNQRGEKEINQIFIQKNTLQNSYLNPNPRGLLRSILPIIPEEKNIVYAED